MFELELPAGAAWEFFLLFAVVVGGPLLVEKARIPGIVGLLLGGYLIGPNGLGLITAAEQTVPEVGQVGLLYLMFLAGLELDLALLRAYRRSALLFALLTFILPMTGGVAVGLAIGWQLPAALLLGSLLASHTLLTYPLIRDRGLGSDPAVASAVGATIVTDTLALIVLAGVAGTTQGSGSGLQIGLKIGVGLAVLIGVSFLVLPRVARWSFRRFGHDRVVRYAVLVLGLLTAAVLAEVFGIEGIVGAFFAGLALNRLVPNEGPLMDRVEFFGSAVFIPVFVVSVGFILDPSVLIQPETLVLAGLFIAACVGGKLVAALLARPLLGFSWPQAGVMFALTVPQAAATLAATTVGFQIGLFGTTVVNAVLVLILFSLIVSPVVGMYFAARVPKLGDDDARLGARLLVAVGRGEPEPGLLRMAARIAEWDGGVVQPILITRDSDPPPDPLLLPTLGRAVTAAGIDGEPRAVVDRSLVQGVLHAAATNRASLVLVQDTRGPADTPFGTWAEAVAAVAPVPVVLVRGDGEMHRVLLVSDDVGAAATELAAELAHRISRSGREPIQVPAGDVAGLTLLAGDVLVVPAAAWAATDTLPQPPVGAAVVLVPPPASPLR